MGAANIQVCEKVRQKKRTTYVEVADELVQQLSDPHHEDFQEATDEVRPSPP